MTVKSAALTAALALVSVPAAAQDVADAPSHAIGTDLSFSTDADDTTVLRIGANFDWRYRNSEDYTGFRLERIRYRPNGDKADSDTRLYVRAAGALGGGWKYQANVGTDFDTVLGSASIHDSAKFRKELFVERDKVETPQGIEIPIYFTYAGGTIDVPVSEQAQLTLLGGVQAFTGSNVRTHLRANAIYVVKPDWGLSVQLRTRYFHDSDPGEYDYYSPRWYAQVLPVIQVRRFTDSGWRFLAAGGLGAERDSRSGWRQSRFLNLKATGPADRKGWALTGEALYSNTPITNADTYDYFRGTVGITHIF